MCAPLQIPHIVNDELLNTLIDYEKPYKVLFSHL